MGPTSSKAGKAKAEKNGHAANALPGIDAGSAQPLSALLEFADPKTDTKYMTKSKVDLVKDVVGATVGDLEKYQREHAFDWRETIKGLGPEGGDRLMDAQAAFRVKFPFPDPVLTESEKAKANGKPQVDSSAPTAFEKADAEKAEAKGGSEK